MRIFQTLGLGEKQILTGGYCVDGKVTEVKTCHWLKVNTKLARINPLDGAQFPHVIYFTYAVNGREYTGSRYVNWNTRCPNKGESIIVYYSEEDPSRCAVLI